MTAYEVSVWVRDAAFVIGAIGGLGNVACIVLGCFVTVPRFDRLTKKEKGSMELVLPIGGAWLRFIKYSVAIALPKYVVHSPTGISMYSEFPYRSHASMSQIVLSYVFLTLSAGFLAGAAAYFVLDVWVMDDTDRLGCPRGQQHC